MQIHGFATTHWSVVLSAADASAPGSARALDLLCSAYWYPIYAFIRSQGISPETAEDLAQSFFARVLEKHYLSNVGPEKGRFRTFLLVCVRNFLANEWASMSALKRGGGVRPLRLDLQDAETRYACEPVDRMTPERVYERRWALTVLERACDALAQEFERAGKQKMFAALRVYLVAHASAAPYAEVAKELKMSEGAVKVAVHRLRDRYRATIREEIRQTVDSEQGVEDEIDELFKAIAS